MVTKDLNSKTPYYSGKELILSLRESGKANI